MKKDKLREKEFNMRDKDNNNLREKDNKLKECKDGQIIQRKKKEKKIREEEKDN